jgi:restriction system protein
MAVAVQCPACGVAGQAGADVGGFRCKSCERDIWIIGCRRCKKPTQIWGSATGSGMLQFRCGSCKARNQVTKQHLRGISADARRLERAEATSRKLAAQRDKMARSLQAESRAATAQHMNAELAATMGSLQSFLVDSLSGSEKFSFQSLKTAPPELAFVAPGPPSIEPPDPGSFMPPEPHGLGGLLRGAKQKHQEAVVKAEAALSLAQSEFEQAQRDWHDQVAAARSLHGARLGELQAIAATQNADVDELERRFKDSDPEAAVEYMSAALGALKVPYEVSREPRIAFTASSKQLVIELELPPFETMPEVREYKYIKSRDEIAHSPLPATERKSLYASLVAQAALAAVHAAFVADLHGTVDSVVLNGHVATVDKRTGQDAHPCLVTLRTTRDRFGDINLSLVDPAECLKGLQASISRNPAELLPVRPLVEFNMADPRFITEANVLSVLDERPNLMDLSPTDFESLITNLFEEMGLETRLTQASRDGGVDCVAYDTRPIFGGKVVIQAKRYKNTVGVSAVRDLFGTMQNEGATKGILVTTSGYGQASHEFANGKPLELIDGPGLLYLLYEHASIEAKIEVPDDWVDPVAEL